MCETSVERVASTSFHVLIYVPLNEVGFVILGNAYLARKCYVKLLLMLTSMI